MNVLFHRKSVVLGSLMLSILGACHSSPRRPTFKEKPGVTISAVHRHREPAGLRAPYPAGAAAMLNEAVYAPGASLYAEACQACHGVLGESEKRGASAERIAKAISEVSVMQGLNLSSAELQALAEALKSSAQTSEVFACSQDTQNLAPVEETIRPLSRTEYRNTLKSLFGAYLSLDSLALDLKSLPIPANRSLPFDNVGGALNDVHLALYQNMARSLSESLLNVPRFVQDAFGSEVCLNAPDMSPSCISTFAAGMGLQIYRRPLTQSDIQNLMQVVSSEMDAREEAEVLLRSALLSSDFLYHNRRDSLPLTQNPKILQLSSYELASRLSYALWADMPDAQLFALAANGQIREGGALSQQVDRMMADPRARLSNARFFEEWLHLRSEAKPSLPPELAEGVVQDPAFADEIAREAGVFVNKVVFDTKGSFRDLLLLGQRSPETSMFQAILAQDGDEQRPGLLWRAVLAQSSMGPSRNLIHQGKLMREAFLCETLPNPPDALNEDVQKAMKQDFRNLSSREEVTRKTAAPACMSCHSMINPIAFAGANAYDAIGRFTGVEKRLQLDHSVLRFNVDTRIEDPAIDAAGEGPVDGPYALAQAMAKSRKAPACYLSKRYAALLGRSINPDAAQDGCALKRSYAVLQAGGEASLMQTLKALIGPEFQYRRIAP